MKQPWSRRASLPAESGLLTCRGRLVDALRGKAVWGYSLQTLRVTERMHSEGGVSRCLFQPLPKIAIWVNDPVSGRLDPLLLFLHSFLTAEHTQRELIDSGLHHRPELPLHKTMLPGRPVQIVKADHGLFPLPLEAHGVGMVLRVLAVIFLYRVLSLKNIIPIRLLLLVAGERIGFVFHGAPSLPVVLCWQSAPPPARERGPAVGSAGSSRCPSKLFGFSCLQIRVVQTETECTGARWIRFLGLPPSTDGPGSCRVASVLHPSLRTALRFNWHILLRLIYIMLKAKCGPWDHAVLLSEHLSERRGRHVFVNLFFLFHLEWHKLFLGRYAWFVPARLKQCKISVINSQLSFFNWVILGK